MYLVTLDRVPRGHVLPGPYALHYQRGDTWDDHTDRRASYRAARDLAMRVLRQQARKGDEVYLSPLVTPGDVMISLDRGGRTKARVQLTPAAASG